MGICSGDFVFVGDVGRPDLLESAAGVEGMMEESARILYKSLDNSKTWHPMFRFGLAMEPVVLVVEKP